MHRLVLDMTVRVSRKEDLSKYCSGVCVSQKWHYGTVIINYNKNFLGNIFFGDLCLNVLSGLVSCIYSIAEILIPPPIGYMKVYLISSLPLFSQKETMTLYPRLPRHSFTHLQYFTTGQLSSNYPCMKTISIPTIFTKISG